MIEDIKNKIRHGKERMAELFDNVRIAKGESLGESGNLILFNVRDACEYFDIAVFETIMSHEFLVNTKLYDIKTQYAMFYLSGRNPDTVRHKKVKWLDTKCVDAYGLYLLARRSSTTQAREVCNWLEEI